MTWFQLIQPDEPEPRQAVRLVPNSAFFLNPALPARPQPETVPVRPEVQGLRWNR